MFATTRPKPRTTGVHRGPQRLTEHDLLNVFLGHWSSDGMTAASADRAAERMTHVHTYRWLPGRFHLLHSWDGHVGSHVSRGIEIIGYDSATSFVFHSFDSDGWTHVYHAQVDDGTWRLSAPRERCTITFADRGRTMTTEWQRSPDGMIWESVCSVCATRSDRPDGGSTGGS